MKIRAMLLGLVLAGAAGLVATATSAQAATGCRVDYAVTSSWPGGFGASVTVTNLGDPVTGWRLTWSFTAGQTVTQLWNGTVTQTGTAVKVVNAGYNGAVAAGGAATFGFLGSTSGATNPVPSPITCSASS